MAFAFSFHTHMPLETMLERLNESSGHEWVLRDSAWYDDYLWCHPEGCGRVRIYDFRQENPRFRRDGNLVVEVMGEDEWKTWALERVLTCVEAVEIEATDTVD